MSSPDRIALRLADAFNRRDVEAMWELLTPDVEIVPLRAPLEGTVYRGTDQVERLLADIDESWRNLRWHIDDVRDGPGWVVALGQIVGSGQSSDVGIALRGGFVARLREGRIHHLHTYADADDALRAVGLSPGSRPPA